MDLNVRNFIIAIVWVCMYPCDCVTVIETQTMLEGEMQQKSGMDTVMSLV